MWMGKARGLVSRGCCCPVGDTARWVICHCRQSPYAEVKYSWRVSKLGSCMLYEGSWSWLTSQYFGGDDFTIFLGPHHYLFEECLKPLVVVQITLVPDAEQVAVGLGAAIELSEKRHMDHRMNTSTRYWTHVLPLLCFDRCTPPGFALRWQPGSTDICNWSDPPIQ